MKAILLATLLLTATAQALPRHVLFAVPRSTWVDASPIKRDKIKTFFRRFTDPNAKAAVGATRYIHTPTGTPVFVCAFWTQHMTRWAEKVEEAKIVAVKANLADNNIRIKFTDDIHAQLVTWRLVPYSEEGGVTNAPSE